MPNPTRTITPDDLESFAIGSWILGTGGGGDPYFSLLEARQHWAAGRSVELIDPPAGLVWHRALVTRRREVWALATRSFTADFTLEVEV